MRILHEHPQVASLFHSARRAVFECVADAPRTARQLTAELGVPRREVERHLRDLCAARLVVAEADGKESRYRADCAGLGALRAAVEAAQSHRLACAFALAFA